MLQEVLCPMEQAHKLLFSPAILVLNPASCGSSAVDLWSVAALPSSVTHLSTGLAAAPRR